MCFHLSQRILRLVAVASLIVGISNQVVVACSGPHTGEIIDRNRSIVNSYGVVAVLILAAIVALSFIIGRLGILAILLALVVGFLHPMLHYGGGGGDCGQSFVALAKYVTMGLGAVLLLQVTLWQFRRRSQLATSRHNNPSHQSAG